MTESCCAVWLAHRSGRSCYEELADQLTDIVVDAVLTIRKPEEAIDLFMVSRLIMFLGLRITKLRCARLQNSPAPCRA